MKIYKLSVVIRKFTEAIRDPQHVKLCSKSSTTLDYICNAKCSWCSYMCHTSSHFSIGMQVSFLLLKGDTL